MVYRCFLILVLVLTIFSSLFSAACVDDGHDVDDEEDENE